MQKLIERKTYTPTDASPVRGNCDLQLNKDQSLSVAGSKTSANNLEVNQAQQTGRSLKALVFVLNKRGIPLMPCSYAKSKKMVNKGVAHVIKRFPFTVQLNFDCSTAVQSVTFGIDSGYNNIGFSAVTKKQELVSGELLLDGKTSSRLTEKRMYRRNRRSKLWYRQSRFLNRKQSLGWLPPSTQRRYDSHLQLLNLYKRLLPITAVTVETANFDIQQIVNPEITGADYQQGDLYGYQNVRAYLVAREHGCCQLCKKRFEKGNYAHVHHCQPRAETGSNRHQNLAPVHKKCHNKLHKQNIELPTPRIFKAETFMSIIQHKFVQDIPEIQITFGYKTFVDRNQLHLPKTHYNDAFVIAGGTAQQRTCPIIIKQKHRNSRRLQINRKGFAPSIRRKHYSIQPKDLVWINGKQQVVSGTHCKGTAIIVEGTKKSYAIKKVSAVYNFGSFVFNHKGGSQPADKAVGFLP